MNRTDRNPWLCRFAVFAALNTLLLLGLGGVVTSTGTGMAVPDWPTTYGENMFTFHPSKWKGGVFWEHTHRLFASWVGLLTVVLAVWIGWWDSRPWLRRLGWLALFLVCVQGLLGGLRVTLYKDEIGIFHAALAQAFFVMLCLIALFTSQVWRRIHPSLSAAPLPRLYALGAGLLFIQLLLGASMRHQHAGLAIPDFPLAYGRLWPATDPATLSVINLSHADHTVTAFQIHLHMVHRIGALVVLIASIWITRRTLRLVGPGAALGRASVIWQVGVLGQAMLGAATVWTGKQPLTATLHVLGGAVCLAGIALMQAVARRKLWLAAKGGGPRSAEASARLATRSTTRSPAPAA